MLTGENDLTSFPFFVLPSPSPMPVSQGFRYVPVPHHFRASQVRDGAGHAQEPGDPPRG